MKLLKDDMESKNKRHHLTNSRDQTPRETSPVCRRGGNTKPRSRARTPWAPRRDARDAHVAACRSVPQAVPIPPRASTLRSVAVARLLPHVQQCLRSVVVPKRSRPARGTARGAGQLLCSESAGGGLAGSSCGHGDLRSCDRGRLPAPSRLFPELLRLAAHRSSQLHGQRQALERDGSCTVQMDDTRNCSNRTAPFL